MVRDFAEPAFHTRMGDPGQPGEAPLSSQPKEEILSHSLTSLSEIFAWPRTPGCQTSDLGLS